MLKLSSNKIKQAMRTTCSQTFLQIPQVQQKSLFSSVKRHFVLPRSLTVLKRLQDQRWNVRTYSLSDAAFSGLDRIMRISQYTICHKVLHDIEALRTANERFTMLLLRASVYYEIIDVECTRCLWGRLGANEVVSEYEDILVQAQLNYNLKLNVVLGPMKRTF